MKITITLDTDRPEDQEVFNFIHQRLTADGLEVSPVGDERPNITIHGPHGATKVKADEVDTKYAELQNQTLAEAMGRGVGQPVEDEVDQPAESQPEKTTTIDIAAESQKARDLIIDACALPDVQVPDVIGMLKERNLPASTDEMKDHPDQIPAVIAALEGFVTSKKAAATEGVAIP